MRPVRLVPLALLTLTLTWTVLAQAPGPMREGSWEVTMKMSMPGLPVDIPPMKQTQCVTAAMLKDPQAFLPTGGPPQAQGGRSDDCKLSDYKLAGSTATWKMTCTMPQPMTATGEIAYAGDAYKGTMMVDMGAQKMTMSFDAKRVGDCAK